MREHILMSDHILAIFVEKRLEDRIIFEIIGVCVCVVLSVLFSVLIYHLISGTFTVRKNHLNATNVARVSANPVL